jgi:hypothetical protein
MRQWTILPLKSFLLFNKFGRQIVFKLTQQALTRPSVLVTIPAFLCLRSREWTEGCNGQYRDIGFNNF